MLWSLRYGSLVLVLAVTSLTSAQQVINIHAGDVSGKIVGIGPEGILVRSLAGPNVLCVLDPERRDSGIKIPGMGPIQVEVTGTVDAEALQKGMVVRFLMELAMGKQVGEVSEVTVLGSQYRPDSPAGMLPEGGNFAEEGVKKPPMKAPTGKFIVIGQIENAKGGFLSVDFPGSGKQRAKLSAEVKVDLQANDLGFARPGDDIRVEGRYVVPTRLHVGKATITRVAKAADDGPKRPVRPLPMGKQPATTKKGGNDGPGNFGVGDPQGEAPPAVAGEAARPKEKGKILKVN